MKAYVFTEPNKIIVEDRNIPRINDNEVLVKIKAAGICGTDIEIFRGRRKVKTPIILGHEASGVAVEVGSKVNNINVGDRLVIEPTITCGYCIMCRRGLTNLCLNKENLGVTQDGVFTEYVKIPSKYAWKLPENISFEVAAIIEPFSVILHALRQVNILPSDNILIVGGGPIGAITALTLKSMNMDIAVQEINPIRRELLSKIGIKEVYDVTETDIKKMINECFNGEYADIVIDAVGTPSSFRQSLNLIRPGGTILVIGLGAHEASFDVYKIVRGELKIRGIVVYLSEFNDAIKMISKSKIDLDKIITHILPMNKIIEGFQLGIKGECLKVILKP